MRRGVFNITLLCFLLLSSCVTQKRCLEKFPPDTIRVETVTYRDTIIPVFVPGYKPIFNWSVGGSVITSSGTAHGQAWIIHDTLFQKVWQTDTTLQVKLDSAIKVNYQKDTVIVTLKEMEQRSRMERILWQVIALAVIVLVIVLIPRILRRRS
jgi:hypothetical protein